MGAGSSGSVLWVFALLSAELSRFRLFASSKVLWVNFNKCGGGASTGISVLRTLLGTSFGEAYETSEGGALCLFVLGIFHIF